MFAVDFGEGAAAVVDLDGWGGAAESKVLVLGILTVRGVLGMLGGA